LSETTELKGSIRVGLTYTVAGYFLPRHYARFVRNYPDIRIELSELPRAAIEEGLKEGTLDIAVMLVSNLEDRERIASETLFRSRRRLWLPVEHPLLQADTIDFADVAQAPYIMLTVDEAHQTASRYWGPTGLQPNVIFVTSSVEAVRSMVADGLASPSSPTWSIGLGRWRASESSSAMFRRRSRRWTSVWLGGNPRNWRERRGRSRTSLAFPSTAEFETFFYLYAASHPAQNRVDFVPARTQDLACAGGGQDRKLESQRRNCAAIAQVGNECRQFPWGGAALGFLDTRRDSHST